MKVRFYRGSMNGKVMHVPDNRTTIQVVNAKQVPFGIYSTNEFREASVDKSTYSMRMMSINLNGQTYRAPAMHPDGSVYFEWDKPRRRAAE